MIDIDILESIDTVVFGKDGIRKEQWKLIVKDTIICLAKDLEKNIVVGFAVIRLGPISYLYSISILKEYRKIGIGTKMLAQTLRYTMPNKVQAHTEVDNTASIRNLQNFGFKTHSYIPDFYFEGVDAILWELNNYAG